MNRINDGEFALTRKSSKMEICDWCHLNVVSEFRPSPIAGADFFIALQEIRIIVAKIKRITTNLSAYIRAYYRSSAHDFIALSR
jgi:hypothetical protein